jgi:hypothetical protein
MNRENQFRGIATVRLSVALVCAIGVGSTAMARTAGSDQAPAAMKNLEGTWRVQVTIVNCATGAEGPPFWSLLTFARGGTLTETTANQALPAPRTPGHGVWAWTGPSSFFAASEAFLLFGPGFAPWTQRIEQTIVMTSDDEFDSDARVIFSVTPSHLQPAQNPPPAPGCARARGYRF